MDEPPLGIDPEGRNAGADDCRSLAEDDGPFSICPPALSGGACDQVGRCLWTAGSIAAEG